MSNAVFPDLPGMTWEIGVDDTFDTIIQQGPNRSPSTRISKDPYAITRYTLKYEFLSDDSADELNKIRGFFRGRQGAYDSFLLDMALLTQNSSDSSVVGQVLTVDGNNYAPLIHTLGSSGYSEPIFDLNGAPVFKGNGSVIAGTTSGPSPTATYGGASYPGIVAHFGSTPAAPVTADFSWYYRVRFEADNADFQYFMYQLLELQQLVLVTERYP